MAFKLTIEQGKGRGQSFDFDADEISIGRAEENDVVLYDNGVSRHHARIALDGDRYVLSDEGTPNGTLLNGERVESEQLEDGDTLSIGQVVFRFEAQKAEGATRITTLEAAEKAAKSKASGATSPGAAGSAKAGFNLTPKQLRLVALGGGALVAFFILVSFVRSGVRADANDCPKVFEYKDGLKSHVIGHGDGECDAGDKLTIEFSHTGKTRTILHFAPFLTDKGELEILLNGDKVGEAQLAPVRRATLQSIVLPDAKLEEGVNTIAFQNTKGDDTWGVERVELEQIGLNEADVQKANEAYELGTRRYRERNVAAPNLYQSWIYLRDARRYMEGLDPKPAMYGATLELIHDVEKDLDKLCSAKRFAAERASKYGKYDEANEAYKFILAAFPGDAHPCRKLAEDSMYLEQASGEE